MIKKIALFLIVIFLFGCSNSDDDFNQIVGNWKLTKAKFYRLDGANASDGIIDYTNDNIIYNFKANGTLIISGGKNVGYENGEYLYFFGDDFLGANTDPKILLVKINDAKWTYNLTNGIMTLGKSYVDGSDLIFERE